MYGATPICPRCAKPVYLAEQTMGPGRKLYHKPCLACTSCNKRLDSFTLLEHDQEPYCKSCHLKLFGTRDLRHANLPVASPPSTSPAASPTNSPLRTNTTGNFGGSLPNAASFPPLRQSFWSTKPANGNPSPSSPTHMRESGRIPAWDDNEDNMDTRADASGTTGNATDEETEVHNTLTTPDQTSLPEADHNLGHPEQETHAVKNVASSQNTPMLTRTVHLNLNTMGRVSSPYKHHTSNSVGSRISPVRASSPLRENTTGGSADYGSPSRAFSSGSFSAGAAEPDNYPNASPQPPRSMPTGTRYGVALGGSGSAASPVKTHSTGSPRKWGGETPQCERCGKSVYFAEQVRAVNKIFHKSCLRCTECGTSLDSRNLRDHEGVLFCGRCYAKNYGPQGGGYALLGKAGG